jgi:hypothetical protein
MALRSGEYPPAAKPADRKVGGFFLGRQAYRCLRISFASHQRRPVGAEHRHQFVRFPHRDSSFCDKAIDHRLLRQADRCFWIVCHKLDPIGDPVANRNWALSKLRFRMAMVNN